LKAKYRAAQLSKNDLILFENKVSRKSQFARGLFVSLSDFDENVVNYFKDRSSRIIALSVPEIYMMCSQEKDLKDVLTRKFRYLDEYGIIYRHINMLF
jgi:predicted helicase